jgi:DNA-binding SARP family transcriptional activator
MYGHEDGLLIKRALRQFLPDVFFHPVVDRFAFTSPYLQHSELEALKENIWQVQYQNDPLGACSLLFVYAAQQLRAGDYQAAEESVLQALALARENNFSCCMEWAYWAAGAVCVQQSAFLHATDYMTELRILLSERGDWVLANLVELIGQSLKQMAGRSIPARYAQISSPVLWSVLHALLIWGKEPVESLLDGEPGQTIINDVPRQRFWSKLSQSLRKVLRPSSSQHIPALEPEVHKFSTPIYHCDETKPVEAPRKMQTQQGQAAVTPLTMPERISFPPVHPTPSLAIYFLGPFRIFQDDHLLAEMPGQKSLSILKYLTASEGKPVSKDILMDQFWPDADSEVARRNLHQAIYAIRQAFKRSRPGFAYIQFENDCYMFHPDVKIWLDFQEFESRKMNGFVMETSGNLESAMAEYGIAVDLYQGDFLEDDLYEDWPEPKRVYFRSLYIEVIDHLCSFYISRKQFTPAILLSKKMLSYDNCSEQAYRYLIRCYLLQGQRQLAMREYQNCEIALKQELNLAPSDATRVLYEQILAAA